MEICSPSRDYERAKQQFSENVETVLNDLVRRSGLDPQENQELVSAFHCREKEAAEAKSMLSDLKWQKGLWILLIVILACAGPVLILFGIFGDQDVLSCILFILLGCILCLAVYFPIKRISNKILPLISEQMALKGKLDQSVSEAKAACLRNIAPLREQLDDRLVQKIIAMTLDKMEIDPYLDDFRVASLAQDRDRIFQQDPEVTTLQVLSGESWQNPFILRQFRTHTLRIHRYTGTLAVEVEYRETDNDGNTVVRTRSETLGAHVDEPMPYYTQDQSFSFLSDAAPDLRFSHTPNSAYSLKSDQRRNRLIRKRMGELLHKHEEQLLRRTDGDVITPMCNEEFDGLFAAFNRNNEQQFRKMFDPAAQQNMVDLIKDPQFGDYFRFSKEGRMIRIVPTSSKFWDLDTSSIRYSKSFDYQEIQENFQRECLSCFELIYKLFAPLNCIPVLQRGRPASAPHTATRPSKYMAEILANKIGTQALLGRKTDAIITASRQAGRENAYRLDVFYYDEEPRVTYVTRSASDGSLHSVPVHWTEYLPRHEYPTLLICRTALTEGEYDRLSRTEAFLQKCRVPHTYKQGLFAWIEDPCRPFRYQDFFNEKPSGEKKQ